MTVSLITTMKEVATVTFLLAGKVPANPLNLTDKIKHVLSAEQFLSP